ncbi:enoyl-CoA hydratase/isomerase family protein [Microbacterium sp. A93]|uniref:enoyl-CoA hydratase/isomerase family protein n=1 Tax=Microbacterium sp. A93 TaxID=3450716 RepID=UPI003F429304
MGNPSEIAHLDDLLDREPHPRGPVTVALWGPPSTGSLRPGPLQVRNIDLVIAAGRPEDESTRNQPLVLVPDPLEELQRMDTAVRSRPAAAEILVRLLRASTELPVETALEMESLAYGTLLGGAGFKDWLHHRKPPSPSLTLADPVILERTGDRLVITLNDPDRHNAYSARMRDALIEALTVPLADDSISAVQITGAGRSLCSGADLGEFGLANDLAVAHLVRTQQHVGRAVATLGDRVHVQAQGACIGAGIEIPAFASRITATPGAFFRLPELQMGLIPGAGGCVSIPRRIGRFRTLYMVLSGITVRADRALRWGLIDTLED